MNLINKAKSLFKKEATIGIMDKTNLLKLDIDFCLICLSPGYVDKNKCGDFNIHQDCFVIDYFPKLFFCYKDAKDVWNKKKNNAERVVTLRNKLKL